jgi:hypothetical protein
MISFNVAAMPLDDQRVVIADLVKRWIEWHPDAP